MKKSFKRVLIALALIACAALGGYLFYAHRARQTVHTQGPVTMRVLPDALSTRIAQMSLEDKIGQLFLIRVPQGDASDTVSALHPGGLLMFGRDFENENPQSLKAKIESWQSASTLPLLIASDEEGGEVTRISHNSALTGGVYASPQALYRAGGIEAVKADAYAKSEELLSYGINFNLAPVADISTNPQSFIYARTLGEDADITAQVVAANVTEMRRAGIGSCLKHFPGYGDNLDSHGEIVRDSRALTEYEAADFKPFEAGIRAGANAVMVTHIIMDAADPERPASLSPSVYALLRDALGFDGVIVTDDFDMAGLADFTTQTDAAVSAVAAGADMIISSSADTQIPALVQAVQDGRLSEQRVDEAVRRILEMKETLGLL